MNILYFTPHAALWAHTAPEAYLARALSECGHAIRYLTCGKALTYCAPMTARRLAPGCDATVSARICHECGVAARAIARSYDFPMDSLAAYLNEDEKRELDAMARNAVEARTLETQYLGVKVGHLALYEFTLAHKKMSTDLTELQWAEYQIYLANALRSLLAFSRYLQANRPDVIMTFSPQYSNINVCMHYAMNEGVRVLFNESGTNIASRLGTMRVWDWKVHGLVNPALTHWGESSLNPVTAETASSVVAHIDQLLTGHHFAVFSSPLGEKRGIRERWGVKDGQKILLMTLSSYDEAYAALLVDGFPEKKVFSDVFRTQADWIKATMEWVAKRPDLFVVLRVHPRDFPNKRENLRSEQSFMLEHLLENVPDNVHVNWPSEGVSLYDLLDDTDALITGWSVTAMEALVLGVPVVTYDSNLPSYPKDIHYTGRSADAYFANIDKALEDGWQFGNALNGFRWLAYNYVTCTVGVSGEFGRFELKGPSFFQKLWSRIKARLPAFVYAYDLRQWRDALKDVHLVSSMIEQGYDALPSARKAHKSTQDVSDEKRIVLEALARLHQSFIGTNDVPSHHKGTLWKIRTLLEREGIR